MPDEDEDVLGAEDTEEGEEEGEMGPDGLPLSDDEVFGGREEEM